MQGSAVKHGSGSVLDRQRQITVYTLSIIHVADTSLTSPTPPPPPTPPSLSPQHGHVDRQHRGVGPFINTGEQPYCEKEMERWREKDEGNDRDRKRGIRAV